MIPDQNKETDARTVRDGDDRAELPQKEAVSKYFEELPRVKISLSQKTRLVFMFHPKARIVSAAVCSVLYIGLLYKYFSATDIQRMILGPLFYGRIILSTLLGLITGILTAFRERQTLTINEMLHNEFVEPRLKNLIFTWKIRDFYFYHNSAAVIALSIMAGACYYFKSALFPAVLAFNIPLALNLGPLDEYYEKLSRRLKLSDTAPEAPVIESPPAGCAASPPVTTAEPFLSSTNALFIFSAVLLYASAGYALNELEASKFFHGAQISSFSYGIAKDALYSLLLVSLSIGFITAVLAKAFAAAAGFYCRNKAESDPSGSRNDGAPLSVMRYAALALLTASLTLASLAFNISGMPSATETARISLRFTAGENPDKTFLAGSGGRASLARFIENQAFLADTASVSIIKKELTARAAEETAEVSFVRAIKNHSQNAVSRKRALIDKYPVTLNILNMWYGESCDFECTALYNLQVWKTAGYARLLEAIEELDAYYNEKYYSQLNSFKAIFAFHPFIRRDCQKSLLALEMKKQAVKEAEYRLITLGGLARIFYTENKRWPDIEQYRNRLDWRLYRKENRAAGFGSIQKADSAFLGLAGRAAIDPMDNRVMRSKVLADGSITYYSIGLNGRDAKGDPSENIILTVKRPE